MSLYNIGQLVETYGTNGLVMSVGIVLDMRETSRGPTMYRLLISTGSVWVSASWIASKYHYET